MSSGSHPLSSVLKNVLKASWPLMALWFREPRFLTLGDSLVKHVKHITKTSTFWERHSTRGFWKNGWNPVQKNDHDHVSIEIHYFGSPSLGNLHVYVQYLNLISTIIQRNHGHYITAPFSFSWKQPMCHVSSMTNRTPLINTLHLDWFEQAFKWYYSNHLKPMGFRCCNIW